MRTIEEKNQEMRNTLAEIAAIAAEAMSSDDNNTLWDTLYDIGKIARKSKKSNE